jgi:MFS transporter, DHA1 family, tetracycline resistance protein
VLGFAAFGLAATGMGFLAGIPLLALWGFASPAALGLMSHQAGASEQGQLQGANASIMGIANLLGPGLFAQTLALSIASRDWHWPGAAFLLAALILLLAIVVAWWTTRRGSTGSPQ